MEKPVFFDQHGNRFEGMPNGPIAIPLGARAVEIDKAQQPEPLEVKPRVYKKYEIRPDSFFYVKFGVTYVVDEIDPECERPVVCAYDKTAQGVDNYWMKFRMWNYLESESWRRAATEKNQYGEYIVNRTRFNELKVRNLLLEWSFDEPKLMHCSGALSDESYRTFTELHPNIVRFVFGELDRILEGNA